MTGRRMAAQKLLVMAVKGNMRAMALLIANDNAKPDEGEAEVLGEQGGLIEHYFQRFLRREKLEGGGSHD